MMDSLTLGQRIAEQRKKLGLSQEALGDKMNVSRQAISKWESDGAVPEIDKLIALSRLFGVSVGWLLGVEEMPVQEKDALSEAQLKTVEEIVRRYRPESSPGDYQMKKAVLGSICLVCLASTLALTVLGLRKPNTNTENLVSQISSLRQENTQIQSRLDDINVRLESMGEGAVLTGYRMELLNVSPEFAQAYNASEPDHSPGSVVTGSSITTDIQLAFGKLSFTAVPQSRREQDTASLTVSLAGQQVDSVPLIWQDNAYRGEFILPITDGYEFCFIQEREGTQQRQYLRQTGCADLGKLTGIEVVVFEPDDILYDGDTLRIQPFSYACYPPELAVEQNWSWTKIDYVLMANEEEVARYSDRFPHAPDSEPISPAFLCTLTGLTFETDALRDGDDIRLYIEMELDSGISLRKFICSMALKDGKIEYSILS